MPRTKIILSYFLSGALHVSVAGAVLVSGWGGVFVSPIASVQGGGAGPSLASVWAPELTSPFDEGPLDSLSGFAGALTVTFIDSTAVEVLRSQPNAEVTIEPPQLLESFDEPVNQSPTDHATQFAALAPPIRLDEQLEADRSLSKPAHRELVSSPVASELPIPVTLPPPENSPVPEKQPDKLAPAPVSQKPESVAVSGSPQTPEPVSKREPATPPGLEASETVERRLGAPSGTADQGRSSAASLANASSDLPPGAKSDQQPRAIPGNPAPKYPDAAYRQGHQGLVELAVNVSAQGAATRVRLLKTSGHALLDQAAIEAVQRWRFQPATYQNRPVNVLVRVPVRFEITE